MINYSRAYCTLFDSNYLSRGLLMIESLIRHSPSEIKMYVYCMDKNTYSILTAINIRNVIPISPPSFESAELLEIKKTRTSGEYCWTCTPYIIRHVLVNFHEPECIYVDADLYFYRDPSQYLMLNDDVHVLITEHRYTKRYDQTKKSGRFCVQFVYFKNEPLALGLLEQWVAQCMEWCYARHENGRFGDQMYLNDWPGAGDWVMISEDDKIGVAPWNIQQYADVAPMPVFFHFHAIKIYEDGRVDLGGYWLQKWVRNKLYKPYIQELIKKNISIYKNYNFKVSLAKVPSPLSIIGVKYYLKLIFKRNYLMFLDN
jgi:hypothetical protein